MELAEIGGYTLGPRLHESARSRVHRGRRKADGLPVIIKLARGEHPSPARLTALRHEHAMLRTLEGAGCPQVLGLAEQAGHWALLLEDFGGTSLRELGLAGTLSLEQFLRLALQLADAVGALHHRRVIHRDVQPGNVVLVPGGGRVALVDFGSATLLAQETTGFVSPRTLEGTLAYMSPEQTGRMNRAVDYRTDYYSLGVTLYELLTGQCPFDMDDPLELVHAHLARPPTAPGELNGAIPPVVSDVVLKLLAKSADDRYQSIHGLKADLAACLEQLEGTAPRERFPVGRQDVTSHFRLPQKLYGRGAEVKRLLAAFERARTGAAAVLVSGYSGSGKTALIQEVYRPLTRQQGYFASGKLEQTPGSGLPHAALRQVLQALTQQVLTESEERVAAWRQRLKEPLRAHAGTLVELCPALEHLLGPQAGAQPLPPTDARNRLNHAVRELLTFFARPEHPLCLFFDDLQWADTDLLKLLVELMGTAQGLSLLLIGSWRDNEVGEAHPLTQAVRELESQGTAVEQLVLAPLGHAELRELVADTLGVPAERAEPLAGLLDARTGGNPFFARAFLASLHADGLLSLSPEGWQWDFERIRQRGATDNVVGLMVDRVRRLPAATQEVLKRAAGLGAHFEVEVLGRVLDAADGESPLARELWPAIAEGLVITLRAVHSPVELAAAASDLRCRFVHDRIQQAVLSLLDAGERARLHRDVGRRLLAHAGAEAQGRWLFDIVGQLNQGRDALEPGEEVDALVAMNLRAARQALQEAAARQALGYARAGLALLGEEDWEARYPLARDLHLTGAEAAFVCSELETLEALSGVALRRARGLMDEVRIRTLEGQVHYAQQRPAEALRTYAETLGKLGFALPATPGMDDIIAETRETAAALGDRDPLELLELPDCEDPAARAAMELLNHLVPITFSQNSPLAPVVVHRMVRLSLRYGNTPESCVGYAFHGLLRVSGGGDVALAPRFGQLSQRLAERYGDKVFLAQAYLYSHIQLLHWKQPLPELAPGFADAHRYALEAGSPYNAASAAATLCICRFLSGAPLTELAREMQAYREVLQRLRQPLVLSWLDVYQQSVLNLTEERPEPHRMTGPFFDEAQRLPSEQQPNVLFNYYYCKVFLGYVFGDFAGALAAMQTLEPFAPIFGLLIWAAPLNMLGALTRLAACADAEPPAREGLLEKAGEYRARLAGWREHCPTTVDHKLLLVDAELARVKGEAERAASLFEQAVAQARRAGYPQEEALAYELAARFHEARGDAKQAKHYLRYAHQAWLRWGAVVKARALERQHPSLLPHLSAAPLSTQALSLDPAGHDFNILDLVSVVHASQAISREITLDRLLARLMELLIATGGAQAGYLLLEHEGRWVVEAEKALEPGGVRLSRSVPLEALEAQGHRGLPASVVHYVARTRESVVLDDAAASAHFGHDPYIARHAVRSVLCFPLSRQSVRQGLVYLENNLVRGAFTRERIQVLQLLAAQASISLENALLYERLEQKVGERTLELQAKNEQLAATLEQLRETQDRMIVQDRLASLGTMTAGIAHELRNPLNFVNSFSSLSAELAQEVATELGQLGTQLEPSALSYLNDTLGQLEANLGRIKEHGRRMEFIIRAMLEHSRGGKGQRQLTSLKQLVTTAVELAYQGMQSRIPSFKAEVELDLDPALGTLDVVPQELNRVIVNVVDNACFAVNQKLRAAGGEGYAPRIRVAARRREREVELRVHDNGTGIPAAIIDRVFNPFFTTKKAGEGTGLGLSLSHDIIVKGHQGTLRVESEEGAHTEFIITLPA